jgi:glucosylceramidase
MVKKKNIFTALSAFALASIALSSCVGQLDYTFPTSVSVYETTGTKAKLLTRQNSIDLSEFNGEDYSKQTIYVDTSTPYQEYYGYGASLTHASAYLLMEADESTRGEILDELFSREGANFSYLRIPIGASDYVPDVPDPFFSCDDMPDGEEDRELNNFSLSHDADIIAITKEIKEINPDVTFMASPRSAPARMKKNQSMLGGGYLKDDLEEVYSDYLVKFVEEYKENGVDISRLTILNEPSVGALSYPTMDMTGEQAARITAYTGEKLADKGLSTSIMAWDFNYGSSSASFADLFIESLFNKEETDAYKYISEIAFHGYDGDGYYSSSSMFGLKDGIEMASKEYQKASMITEITENSGASDFASNMTYAAKNVVINPCAVQTNYDDEAWNGASGSLYRNLVLDSNGQPTPAYHENECLGVIALDAVEKDGVTTFKYTKSSAYYTMAQVSKFMYKVDGVEPRAIKAMSDYADLAFMAYYRADGAIVIVVSNTNETNPADIDVVIDEDKAISYSMVPQSIVTFVC